MSDQMSLKFNPRLIWVVVGVLLAIIVIALVVNKTEQPTADRSAEMLKQPSMTEPTPDVSTVVGPKVYGQMFLIADQSQLAVNDLVTVEIRLDTGGANVNLAKVVLNFDERLLAINQLDYNQSVLFMQFKEEALPGSLTITRGRPGDADYEDDDDGFTGSDGLLARVVFKTLAPGQAQVSLDNDKTKMYLDDGSGTEVKLDLEGVSLSIE